LIKQEAFSQKSAMRRAIYNRKTGEKARYEKKNHDKKKNLKSFL